MRTLTATEQLLYQRGRPLFHQRLLVWDGLAWQDLSTLAGRDWMMSASWNEQRDNPVTELEVVLRRERYFESFAPLQASRLNRTTGSYSLLIDLGRPVRFEVALSARDSLPAAGDWRRVFEGMISAVDVGSPHVRIRAMDRLHSLQRLYIKQERVYGSTLGVAVEDVVQQIIKDNHGQTWQSGLTLSATTGDLVTPTTQNGFFYRCIVSGTTAGGEPVWPTTIGATVVSGTATLRCQGVCPTLWVPVPTSAVRTTFTQRMVPVLQACLDVIVFIGWDLRYRYRPSSGNFELCLYNPNRSVLPGGETWGWTGGGDTPPAIGQGYYHSVLESGGHLLDFRTDVILDWPDGADPNPDGTFKRKRLHLADVQAREDYNESLPRTFMVVEGTATQIDTLAEATTFATALLQDVSLPPQVRRLAVPLWPFGEVQDFYRILANGVDGDADEYLAVLSLEHHIGGEGGGGGDPGTTIITFHGTRPARRGLGVGQGSWLQYMGYPLGNSGPPPTAGPGAPTNVQASKVQGGVAVTFDPDRTVAKVAEVHELHLSTTSGFTPDSTTFRAMARNTNRFEVGDLTPGVTYYAKVVPQDNRSQRGTPSAQVAIDAGYTTPAALQPLTSEIIPDNPSFEAGPTSAPPETWSMVTGTWSTDAAITTASGTVFSGARAVELKNTAVQTALDSRRFIVEEGEYLTVTVRAKVNTTDTSKKVQWVLTWYDLAGASISSTTVDMNAVNPIAWLRSTRIFQAPAGAKTGGLVIKKGSADTFAAYIDSIRGFIMPRHEEWTQITNFAANWASGPAVGYPAAYKIDSLGHVHLRGVIRYTGPGGGGAPPAGQTNVANFTSVLAPISTVRQATWYQDVGNGDTTQPIAIYLAAGPQTNIDIWIKAGNNGGIYFGLDGIIYEMV